MPKKPEVWPKMRDFLNARLNQPFLPKEFKLVNPKAIAQHYLTELRRNGYIENNTLIKEIPDTGPSWPAFRRQYIQLR